MKYEYKTSNYSIKDFLAIVCVMLSVTVHATEKNNQEVLDTISVDNLAKKEGRWTHFKCLMVIPAQGTGLDNFWHWIINNSAEMTEGKEDTDSIVSLKNFVEHHLKSYEVIEPYDSKKFLELKSHGEELNLNECRILPKGEPLGSIQMYSVKYTIDEKNLFELNIVYDKSKDKVLTVDDIFIPETAMKIKEDFGKYFINIGLNNYRVFCGYIENGKLLLYNGHSYDYIGHKSDLTDDFKQTVGFNEIVENLKKEREKFAKEKEIEQKDIKTYLKEKEEEDRIYESVHVMPKLGLRKKEVKEFFNNNFHWPEELKRENYKDWFSVLCIVEKDGSIGNVHMKDSTFANSPIEKEMERVIKLMPPCVPGRYDNKPVRVQISLAFSFNQKSPSGITYKSLVNRTIDKKEEITESEMLIKTAGAIISLSQGKKDWYKQ